MAIIRWTLFSYAVKENMTPILSSGLNAAYTVLEDILSNRCVDGGTSSIIDGFH